MVSETLTLWVIGVLGFCLSIFPIRGYFSLGVLPFTQNRVHYRKGKIK